MTPEEFKAKYRNRVAEKYLAEPDKVLMTTAYSQMTSQEKTAIQRAMEAGNYKRAMNYQEQGRKRLALSLADTRLDEISADGNVNLDTEMDEFL